MQPNEAIRLAKQYVNEVFAEEGVINVGLEEIERDGEEWDVTIGFSRRWDRPQRGAFSSMTDDLAPYRRTYKVVTVKDDGSINGVRNRVGLL